MSNQNNQYNVCPKVVPANKKSTIAIKPPFSFYAFKPDRQYEIVHYPVDYSERNGRDEKNCTFTAYPKDGILYVELYFEGEQEHIIYVNDITGGGKREIGVFSIYSLEKDLYNRRPYKGDMHMHTYYSDGLDSPAYVAASCRKVGLDFMAITDHGKYEPSIEAQQAYQGVDIDLRIFRGEEVHPPRNPLHIVNFGGSFSVNEMFEKDRDTYIREVADIEREIAGEVRQEPERYQLASAIWCFDKIRQGGGLGIFCHPFWRIHNGYYISTLLTEYLYEKQPYDALELIGGYHRHELDSNILQVASYHEQRAKGRKIPIVGVTDAHGCDTGELFGWYYTIVFSPSLKFEDLRDSIKDFYSVAVEAVPGERQVAHGEFRLVKYALFLLREVLPQHDEICLNEGNLMIEYIKDNNDAKKQLEKLKGGVDSLYSSYWTQL